MASRRMIDPAFWESHTVASLTREQRLTFVGLFSNADDQGRMKAHPALLRSKLYPYDDIGIETIEAELQAIARTGAIHIYGTDGCAYIQITGWWKYQHPNWAWPSDIPAPDGWVDRVRYRKGNTVIDENWDNEPTMAPEWPHDEPAPEPAPSGSGSGSGSILSAGAEPQPEPEKPKRQPTKHDTAKAELEAHFSEITGIPKPAPKTDRQKSTATVRWWNPLSEIASLVDDDVGAGKALISDAVAVMDAGGLTLDAPQSILKTVTSEFGRQRRDNGKDRVLKVGM